MEKTTAEMEGARIERMKEVEVAMHMPGGDAYIIMKGHANHPLWWLEWNLLTPNTNHADRFIKQSQLTHPRVGSPQHPPLIQCTDEEWMNNTARLGYIHILVDAFRIKNRIYGNNLPELPSEFVHACKSAGFVFMPCLRRGKETDNSQRVLVTFGEGHCPYMTKRK